MKSRILLVDEDESVRKMVGRVLESAGYSVAQAGTRDEVATGLRTAPPDLVVWDLEMPCANSGEALQFEHSVPVVGTTAWPNQDKKALRMGIRVLLEKPLDLSLLLQAIHKLLNAREQEIAARLAPAL